MHVTDSMHCMGLEQLDSIGEVIFRHSNPTFPLANKKQQFTLQCESVLLEIGKKT